MADDNNTPTPEPMLLVCTWCSSEQIKKCIKCGRLFCTQHTSRVTPQACKECFNGVSVIFDRFTKVTEDYDSVTDEMVTRRESCDRIRLDGPDYTFYTEWINQLSDEELKNVFEFHYFIVKQIEHENELRKVKKAKKLRETPVTLSSRVTEVKVRKESKPKDMRTELRKQFPNMPDALIESMIKAAQES